MLHFALLEPAFFAPNAPALRRGPAHLFHFVCCWQFLAEGHTEACLACGPYFPSLLHHFFPCFFLCLAFLLLGPFTYPARRAGVLLAVLEQVLVTNGWRCLTFQADRAKIARIVFGIHSRND